MYCLFVCFAECVDDGEIIVVLSFADRPRDFVQPNAGRQLTTYWPAAASDRRVTSTLLSPAAPTPAVCTQCISG